MKKQRILTIVTAVLLGIAPVSTPFVSGFNSQAVQASRRVYYTHTRNWTVKHYYNKHLHRYTWMRMRKSRLWQKEYKKCMIEDKKRLAHFYDTSFVNYNNANAIQQIKSFEQESITPLFPTSHATVYVVPCKPLKTYKSLVRDTRRAGKMWKPEFKFTMTYNRKKANVIVTSTHKRNDLSLADEVSDDYKPETHKEITLYWRSLNKFEYDNRGITYVLIHELGHTIGLPHDTNLDSIMASDDTGYDPTDNYGFTHYQAGKITQANKRAVEELYHEQ